MSKVDELVLVGGMTRMPKVIETARRLIGKAPHQGVNPDEVVAVGAAIQGGVLKGEVKDVLLLDVTPLTLGIETLGGIFTPLIERNTTIPTKKSEIFSTAADSQSTVEIHVLQGERKMAGDNKTIGRFHLDGIPPAPRGVPQIEVTFDIDANGILHVSAKDLGTGKEQKITITASSGISESEIKNMVRDAEQHAADDTKRREAVEVKNRADALLYETEKFLKEHGDKTSADNRRKVEAALEDLRGAVKSNDTDRMKTATEGVTAAMQAASADMYAKARQAGKAPGGGEGPGPGPGEGAAGGGPAGGEPGAQKAEGEVIDADFEMVDDDKKKKRK
jgi:molecular chaperone DnaK